MSYAHVLIEGGNAPEAPLVLLHGSDGTETDLLPLAELLAPDSVRISVRGAVASDAGYAFFRRFPDRRVDEADVAARVPALADFIESTCAGYGRPIAVGFSNGAIMAAALLLARPGLLAGAILFRPLSPFAEDLPHRLDGTPVLVLDGAEDTRRSPGDGTRLAERLRHAGATVTQHVLPTGHMPGPEDLRLAQNWLRDWT
jgi:phospholipase/carboxylesterase